ncbi:MAG: pseudouridylate synthase [Fulvivirga sp.]
MSAFNPLVLPFQSAVAPHDTPEHFPNPYQKTPHPLAQRAAYELQEKLNTQTSDHNFSPAPNPKARVAEKMLGVLVVKAMDGALGYLAGCSGKLNNEQFSFDFVPSVLNGAFLDTGMQVIEDFNHEIKGLADNIENSAQRKVLMQARKAHSNALNDQIYDNTHFLNQAGVSKSLRVIFEDTHHANPPGGAGDCAAPRLMQYAFKHQLTPLTMAEFWWGQSTKATDWRHRTFYTPCTHKCRPILHHMLEGLLE